MYDGFHTNMNCMNPNMFPTLIIIINVIILISVIDIIMISEGSCDTEDWSNAEKRLRISWTCLC